MVGQSFGQYRIAFRILGRDGNQKVMIVPVAGGTPVPLDTLPFAGTNLPFAIASDGRTIVTTRPLHLASEIWLLRPGR